MTYDRKVIITTGNSRKSVNWQPQTLWLSELYQRLQTPMRGAESYAAYMGMRKSEQDARKDVGGFVAGALAGTHRKASAVTGREIVTLDMDSLPPGATEDALRRLEGLGCGYCVYSTRKHAPEAPRLRVLLPLDHMVSADEYEAIARKAAQLLQPEMGWFDPTTFEASRLMYWPSCCADSVYIYNCADKPYLNAEGVLHLYGDGDAWRNMAAWPQVPGMQEHRAKLAARQADPTGKVGVVGAFCRTYDIEAAMDKYLPEVYEPAGANRFTYTKGSTAGGAVLYDDGKWLYSHHATDPCSGKLVNAFDLVRLHLYGELDDEAETGTPMHRLPSFKAMTQLALQDGAIADIIAKEQYEHGAVADFAGLETQNPEAPAENETGWHWRRQLEMDGNGKPQRTTRNVLLMLEGDPQLKGRIRLDTFADAIMLQAPLPWAPRDKEDGMAQWGEADDTGLRVYAERQLGYRSREIVNDALIQCAQMHAFNPVTDYLDSLKWDGIPRLDKLFVDYLGAENCAYVHAATRKMFVGAVARSFQPGTKFDYMAVIHGYQGLGKSTILYKMGNGWFSDSIKTFIGKDAAELLQGVLLVEIGELEAFDRTDINAVKSFLSKRDDQYRAAYARKSEKHLRKCVFFGTTNDFEYLKDPTGNRRFWPIDAGLYTPKKSVFTDLTQPEIDQIWAEAVAKYCDNEPLFFTKELEQEAERRRQVHFDIDPLQGQIEDFLAKPIPEDWQEWDARARSMFWGGGAAKDVKLVPRDRICAVEIWRECMGGPTTSVPRKEAMRINKILANLPDWKRVDGLQFGAGIGRQRGFLRV